MKQPPDRDWPFAITLTVLIIVVLVAVMLDPSCHFNGLAIPTR